MATLKWTTTIEVYVKLPIIFLDLTGHYTTSVADAPHPFLLYRACDSSVNLTHFFVIVMVLYKQFITTS